MSSTENTLFLCATPPSAQATPLPVSLEERGVAFAPVPCANVYTEYVGMARRSAVVQPYQFDPESDPEGEAPEEIPTLRLQQDVSEWLVTNIICLDIFFYVVRVCCYLHVAR